MFNVRRTPSESSESSTSGSSPRDMQMALVDEEPFNVLCISDPKPEGFKLHPLFTEGDTTLAAKGGSTFFRVYSHTLKMTSGFFRSMFSLPQDPSSSSKAKGVFYLDEDEDTLECLLRMMCGLSLPPVDSYDQLDSLLDAVEKYDTPGPLSIVRLLVMTPALTVQPFRLYGIACRFGWEAEAKHASTQTLQYNLYDPAIRPLLQRLSTDSLLNLMQLHRSRREGLRQRLNDPPFVAGSTATCVSCHSLIDYHTWRELKYKIILEMDKRPLGDTVIETGLLDWPEAVACWTAKCPESSCHRSLYDKVETLRVIRDCVEKLPKSI
ncbi:uncharacterized protein EV420DRAFT_1529838 [Desarmillaria tabescens]|uniref:BTB domain-containing protein n=1 Tax=Armillaria tabescens TaxID=1929756 RepID=A0AA39N8K9_ARMTA|nr:uncharacterized protein EV420DRAFT_1529838 [Desarmillaria tabescens]KAK0461031.1 hypothetical protein EV420DRAFT_1529838 [Desarmillaria tabescens]